MRQRFFTKTIQSDFIKSLLYNTPLPICDCVCTGDYLVKGSTYVYNRSLIRCTKNGYLRPPFRSLQTAPWNNLNIFILGLSTLGFRQIITKVASGARIMKGTYYLLGQYDLRYKLEDPSQHYNRFNPLNSYSLGDIVINSYLNKDYLYMALDNVSPGPWDSTKWQYILAHKEPYELIKCTDTGKIDDMPAGASYQVVQEFEPEIVQRQGLDSYLSGNTYYVLANNDVALDSMYWNYSLIYNDQPGYLHDEIAEYQILSSYIPESYYTLYTQRYLSSYDYYDSETHKELGRLLRFYRSQYQLNLLPFYNCWDGSYLDGFAIKETPSKDNSNIIIGELQEIQSSSNKLIKVPIKFNKTYTIALDCNSEVRIMPAFIKLNDTVKIPLGLKSLDLTEQLLTPFDSNTNLNATYSSLKKYNQCTFTRPITYTVYNMQSEKPLNSIEPSIGNIDISLSEFLQRYENDLYLIIELPANNDSSVVVLEGDYTDSITNNIINMTYLNNLSEQEFNSYLLSNLSLLLLNDKVSYPFADRLMEYLLDNVISNRDEIGEDILRVRKALGENIAYDKDSVAWDEYLRKTIYDLYMNTSATLKQDINGFVDKDVEQFINLL